MTKGQFQIQIDRLCETFDDKYFSDQRLVMIWEMAEGLSYEQFIDVVDQFIKGSKQAPLPQDFQEALKGKGTLKTYSLGEAQSFHINICRDCADSGFIRLQRNEGHAAWAKWDKGSAPCHCHRGKALIASAQKKRNTDLGPQFGEHWRDSYSAIAPFFGEGLPK